MQVDGLVALTHKPWVVLTEVDPWRGVIGSDVPTTVLYEDGLVIGHRGRGPDARAWTALAPEPVAELVRAIVTDDLLALPEFMSRPAPTDQPTVRLLLRRGERWALRQVYGLRRQDLEGGGEVANTPAAFVEAYRRLLEFSVPQEKPWEPAQIEIMLWDFSHAKEPSEAWPSSLPAPPATIELPKHGVYKHMVAGTYEAAAKKFMSTHNARRAIRHGEHLLSFSYRRRVPEEDYLNQVRACLSAKPEHLPTGCR